MRAKTIPPLTPRQEERFWNRVEVPEQPSCCWEWRKVQRGRGGYGSLQIRHNGRRIGLYAHRVSYSLLIGPIPPGMELDHLCKNRRCVNPDHLQVVTTKVNVLRSQASSAVNARKTHCKRGHEFTPENTIWSKSGTRACKTCKYKRVREIKQRQRAEILALRATLEEAA